MFLSTELNRGSSSCGKTSCTAWKRKPSTIKNLKKLGPQRARSSDIRVRLQPCLWTSQNLRLKLSHVRTESPTQSCRPVRSHFMDPAQCALRPSFRSLASREKIQRGNYGDEVSSIKMAFFPCFYRRSWIAVEAAAEKRAVQPESANLRLLKTWKKLGPQWARSSDICVRL